MGSYVRLYLLPDGKILGFYREQGGVMMVARIPGKGKNVYAYANPENEYRFELMAATRQPKSIFGQDDNIMIRDNKTQSERSMKAKFLGIAYEAGQNRYIIGRATQSPDKWDAALGS